MRTVIQRVTRASVSVNSEIVGSIHAGLLVLIGVHTDDEDRDSAYLANKIPHLRIFDDDAGRMNLSLLDINADLLLISQFTLLADCRRGRRPSWNAAAPPEKARAMYLRLAELLRDQGIRVETGQFQAMMEVSLVNDGPVSIILDSR